MMHTPIIAKGKKYIKWEISNSFISFITFFVPQKKVDIQMNIKGRDMMDITDHITEKETIEIVTSKEGTILLGFY